MTVKHVISVSGGKDSTATLLIAIARVGLANLIAIFCDTGNEHADTYAYLGYLEQALGLTITRLKADFTAQLAAKRQFIALDQRTGRDKKGRKLRWSNKAKRRALSVMYPSGNPFLDLCMWKGLFPSRKAQFCTEELKTNMAVAFQLELMDAGHNVISWQGIRRDESQNRRNAKKFERVGRRLRICRPIVDNTAAEVFAFAAARGIKPNPLYLQDMGRVGCMPCINARKGELRAISVRFPEHPARIAEWEQLVGMCSKRGFSTFFGESNDAKDLRTVFADLNIWARIEWSKTSRGGQQFNLLDLDENEPSGCSSSYGLCDQAEALAASP
jgi:3'-phosphoadenosine 5'-phosphosulfate sulfotransferase (PAPS reductase)/FAD synthetase